MSHHMGGNANANANAMQAILQLENWSSTSSIPFYSHAFPQTLIQGTNPSWQHTKVPRNSLIIMPTFVLEYV
jgi:hypothetical protein